MSGFTEEQLTFLQAMIVAAVHEAFDKQFKEIPSLQSFGPAQSMPLPLRTGRQSTPPAPHAQKKKKEQQKPLY